MNTFSRTSCATGDSTRRRVLFAGLIVVLVGLGCSCLFPPQPKILPASARAFVKKAPITAAATNEARISGFTREDFIDVKLKDYQERAGRFHAIIYWQVGLAFMCLLLIGRYSTNVNLPILGIKFPSRLLFFLVPIVMCYLWLEFGYELESVIDRRLALVSYIAEEENAPKFVPHHDSDDLNVVRQRSSLLPLLADSGFIDGWFVSFWPGYTIDSSEGRFNKAIFCGVFGLMLGLIAAVIAGFGRISLPLEVGRELAHQYIGVPLVANIPKAIADLKILRGLPDSAIIELKDMRFGKPDGSTDGMYLIVNWKY